MNQSTTEFTFTTSGRMISQAGACASLADVCSSLSVSRPLIVTDQGVVNAGLLSSITKPLDDAGLQYYVFADVVADPPESVVEAAVEFAKRNAVDGVIGFGGGSPMDTAKLVALLCKTAEPLAQIYGVDQTQGPRLPLLQIPTTAGTGSEVTSVAIVTTGENSKMGVVSSCLMADVAILDAELTLGLPPSITASTGIDAMVHAIEAYTSKRLKNFYSDMLAQQALSLLCRNLPIVLKEPKQIQARQNMLLGATLAGQAFANSPVAAVHALAYPLGGQFHIPHGLSNSLLLTEVMRFNRSAVAELYCELAPFIMGEAYTQEAQSDNCDGLIQYLEQYIAETQLPTRLREVDIPEAALAGLAQDALQQQRLLVNNPKPVTETDALKIYQACY